MQQGFFLQGVTLDQFVEALRPVIRHELAQLQQATPSPSSAADEMLTVQQAAELLDLSVATIHEHKRTGKLPYTRLGGRVYLKRSDLLAAGTREQRTPKPARRKS